MMGIFDFITGSEKNKKDKAYDPVCGMSVNKEESKIKSTYQDKTYYFCSENCKKQFDEDPKNFI